MKELKTLYKKQYLILKNKYLSTKTKKITSFLLLLGLLFVLVAIGYFFTSDILSSDVFQNPEALKKDFAFILFFIILVFSFFQMTTSAQVLVQNFYESTDIQYLLSMPIPIRSILIFKLLNHTFKVVCSESIFAVPMILYIAVNLNVYPFFYILFPIIYFFAASTATCLGIIFGILYLKRFSIKSYKLLIGITQIFSYVIFWLIFVTQRIGFDQFFTLFDNPIFNDYIIYLLPAYTGSLILSQVAFGLTWSFIIYIILFFSVIFLVLYLTSLATGKAFHSGLMKVTLVKQKKVKKRRRKNLKAKIKNKSTLMTLALTKVISIRLKTQFIPAVLSMFIPYFLVIAAFATGKIEFSLITDYALMIGLGCFFITSGVNILMLDEQATNDVMYDKNQYCLLKILPVSSLDYFFSRVLATFIPTLFIMTISLLITFIFKKISITMGLTILIIQGLILIGGNIQSHAIAVKINEKTNKGINWGYNILSILYSFIYYFITFVIIIIYDNSLIFNWSLVNNLNISSILGGLFIYLLIQYTLFPKMALKSWENTEF